MASLPYPRSYKTIFPQKPTQPNHLCASVRIRGRLFSARSFCVFRGFCGRIAMLVHECSVGAAETAAPPERTSVFCEIRGRLFSARSFCEFREFRGRRTLRSLTICEICGRLFYARSFCVFCEFCGRLFSARNFCEFREFCGRTLRSLTICGHLCASVGGSSTPEVSVNSVNSVGEPYAA